MTTTPHRRGRDLALTVVTAVIGLAATAFAVVATMYLFTL